MIEEIVNSGEIFSRISKEGLSCLAIGFLLEKSGVPNCFESNYSKRQDIDLFVPNIECKLKEGVMAGFWERIYDYAIQNKGFGEKIEYTLINWLSILSEYISKDNVTKENALHQGFLEVFSGTISYYKELSKEKAKYMICEISLLSFLPNEFESEIKKKIKYLIKNHSDFEDFLY